MSVVSWLKHRVRGQELWVLIPALPLNHSESCASHFVLEPFSNFPMGWLSGGKLFFHRTATFWMETDCLVSGQGRKGHQTQTGGSGAVLPSPGCFTRNREGLFSHTSPAPDCYPKPAERRVGACALLLCSAPREGCSACSRMHISLL